MKFDWQSAARNLAKIFPKNRWERRARERLEKEENAASAGTPIALACSGGADSLAATLLAWAHFPRLRERFFVLHFNHGVRGAAADGDAAFAREVADALGIRFFSEKLADVPAEPSENFLREARLDFFAQAMREHGAKILIQGHQRDDVAETLLMRLVRGAGTAGLAAPRVVSEQADGRVFLRPLLGIGKKSLLDALRENGIPWREDASNAESDFFRNRVRGNVLPVLREASPYAKESLRGFARSRDLLAEDADALDAWSDRVFAENFAKNFEKTGISPKSEEARLVFAFPPEIPRAITRRLVWKIFAAADISPKSATCADALVDALDSGTRLAITLPDGKFRAETERKILRLSEKKSAAENFAPRRERRFSLSELPAHTAEFSAEIVPVDAELFREIRAGKFSPKKTVFLTLKNFAGTAIFARKWRAGERFRPLGASGEKTLGDAFTDKKILREARKKLPVFADAAGIAWVPGLPPAERFRLDGTETAALRLTYAEDSLPL